MDPSSSENRKYEVTPKPDVDRVFFQLNRLEQAKKLPESTADAIRERVFKLNDTLEQLHKSELKFVEKIHNEEEKRREKQQQQQQQKQSVSKEMDGDEPPQEHEEIVALRKELESGRQRLTGIGKLQEEHTKTTTDLKRQREDIRIEIESFQSKRLDYLENQLISGVKEWKMEVMQGQTQVESLQKDLEERHAQWQDAVNDRNQMIEEKNDLAKAVATQVEIIPRIAQQSEQLQKKLRALTEEINNQLQIYNERHKEFEVLNKKKIETENLSVQLKSDYEKMKLEICQMEERMEQITAEKALEKERIQEHKEEKQRIEAAIKAAVTEVRLSTTQPTIIFADVFVELFCP